MQGQAEVKIETITNTRLTLGNYIADILLDERHHAKIFHWIVQKLGSPSILSWGQEYTFEDAKNEAQSYLESCVRKDQLKEA